MAGYVFLLNENANLDEQTRNGIYSTNMKNPNMGFWSAAMEGTIADYMSMQDGDNIYFFKKRKIYGIGELVSLKGTVIAENFPGSFLPDHFLYKDIKKSLLVDVGSASVDNRMVCFFRPNPYFFREGVDMDDVLSSAPEKFKMLRLIQQVSFIKVDDQENQALKNIILKRSLLALNSPDNHNTFDDNHETNHIKIKKRLSRFYNIKLKELLMRYVNPGGSLRHEMLVECAMLYQLNYLNKGTLAVFGEWDYLSHQVGASPFKPIAYMDRIDIFGFAYIPGHSPTVAKYLVVEIKANTATKDDLNQLMKYVAFFSYSRKTKSIFIKSEIS